MIKLSKSSLNDKEKQSVMGVLDREYLGMGVEVQKFEKNLSVFFNRPALCVVNGTAALHLALQACGIGSGDEVLVQSLTYIASFQAISATGAKPIACDIVPETITLDLNDAEKQMGGAVGISLYYGFIIIVLTTTASLLVRNKATTYNETDEK